LKALILNGALKDENVEVNRHTEEILGEKGYQVESVLLKEKKIGECLGCFHCWVKTPGICVIDDYGRTITENIINSDLLIYLTPVVFGGYSSELKKAVDRVIPLILPFFSKVNGEIHHAKRYEKYPKVIVLGIMTCEDNQMKDTFNSLIKRNSINWYNSFSGGTIQINLEEETENQLKEILIAAEVVAC